MQISHFSIIMNLDKFSIKQKLFFIILSLISVGLFSSIYLILNYYESYQKADKINSITKISISTSQLVHEIQKERGFTAGYLASGKQKFVSELQKQRNLVNQKLNDLKKLLDIKDKSIMEELDNLNFEDNLINIEKLRKSIDANQTKAQDAIEEFTFIIGSLIQVNRLNMDKSAEYFDLYKLTKSLFNLTQIKENTGQIRANINRIATLDSVDYNSYQNVSRLYHNNNLLTAEFNFYLPKKYSKQLENLYQDDTHIKVYNTINFVLHSLYKKGLSINPNVWFENSTNYINKLAEIEVDLSNDILNTSKNLQNQYYSKFLIYSTLLILLYFTFVWLTIWIVSNIVKNLTLATKLIQNISKGIF